MKAYRIDINTMLSIALDIYGYLQKGNMLLFF